MGRTWVGLATGARKWRKCWEVFLSYDIDGSVVLFLKFFSGDLMYLNNYYRNFRAKEVA